VGGLGSGEFNAGGPPNIRGSILTIDPKTGRIAWRHSLPGGSGPTGMLTTAGGLLFAGDGAGNLVAFDAANGTPLWNTRLGNVTNAPQTYMLDGKQHVLVAAGDQLYTFRLN
jgi:alcohol dehydrogenase (cytochrome c)